MTLRPMASRADAGLDGLPRRHRLAHLRRRKDRIQPLFTIENGYLVTNSYYIYPKYRRGGGPSDIEAPKMLINLVLSG
jgi:hypothetical protein